MSLLQDPRARELVISLGILAASYVAARVLSFLFGKVLASAARRTATTLDDRLVVAVRRPVTYALFLIGGYVAVHRSPLPTEWKTRTDQALFILSVLLITLALIRAYAILLAWYTNESPRASSGALGAEFGPLLSRLGSVAIALIAGITILEQLGVKVESLVVSLGVGSLAVGLAAQDTLANMFAGFTLMLDRPFKIGDRIQLASGEVGDVTAIGMRATRLKTPDESVLVIPNSVLTKDKVTNQSLPTPHVTARIDVGVAYGTDLPRARDILTAAALASELTDPDRPPQALVTRFGEYAVSLRLVFWPRSFTDQGLAVSQVHEEIYRRFADAGIEIPFPVRRIVQEAAP
ncbi:MAG: mechanosensitive ion channel family protein [Vicinamibacteria bacterium]